MTGVKQKDKGWNPFKRSNWKQKVLQDSVLYPYENGLCSQSLETYSNRGSFSVSSMAMDNDEGEIVSNGSAMGLPTQVGRKDQEENQPTLETKIMEVERSSFDSLFDSAVEANLEESDFFNDPFIPTQAAPRQVTIHQQTFEDHWQQCDPEDFESVVFDPRAFSQGKTGDTPKSFVLHATRSATTSNNDEVLAGICDSEKENDFHDNSFSEFTSPVKLSPKIFEEGSDDPDSLSNHKEKDENQAPFEGAEDEAREKRPANKQGEVQETTSRNILLSKQSSQSLLLAKRRKSRPLRSRLKGVLATKAVSNATQVKSPSSCPNSATVESRGETGNRASGSGTNRTRTPSQTTPTAGTLTNPNTAPHSKKIWSNGKRATPESSVEPSDDEKKSAVSLLLADDKGGNTEAEDEKEVVQPIAPTMASTSPFQHPSEEKSRAVLTSRATTFSDGETPRNGGRSIVQSKSEIPNWGAQEDCLRRGMGRMCAATQSFEIKNMKLNSSSAFCCGPLKAKKQIQGYRSAAVSMTETQEDMSTSTSGNIESHANEGKSPPPPPLPPLPTTLSSSLKCDQFRLLPPHPPTPPPRPGTPPRLVVVKPMRKQASTRETPKEISQPQGSGGAKAQETDGQSFEQLEVFLEASPEEKNDPAVNASKIMRGTLQQSQEDTHLSNILEGTVSSDRVDNCSTSLSQLLLSGLSTGSLNGHSEEDSSCQPECRLRKKTEKMTFLNEKKKTQKSVPLPFHQPQSADTAEDNSRAPFMDWFGTQNSKSLDPSTNESAQKDTWTTSVLVGELEQEVLKSSAATATFASGLVKTPTSNLIYWSGSTDDFELVAVSSSKQLSVASIAFSSLTSSTKQPSKIAPAKRPFSHPNEGTESTSPESVKMQWGTSQHLGANKGTRLSPCTDKALPMLGHPGVESKTHKIRDTNAADFFVSAFSTLSDSSSSGGSAFSYGHLDSDDEGSCAFDSAILTPSLLARQGAIQHCDPTLTVGQVLSIPYASTSDSDEDIFRNVDGNPGRSPIDASVHSRAHGLSCTPSNSQVNQSMSSRLVATHNAHPTQNSLPSAHQSLSTSSSADYSSTDSRSELNDVEAHIQMAQEWMQKIKATILGIGNGDSAVEHGSIGNTVQCEYAGVLGRLKIDINQNK